MNRLKTGIILVCILTLLCGCGGKESRNAGSEAPVRLRFRDCMDETILEALDGKTVTASGYLSQMYPKGGGYVYLMSMPGLSAPFCVPNSNQLVNSIAVSAPKGRSIDFTEGAVRITGTLEFGEKTDDSDYCSSFRIVNAAVEKIEPDPGDAFYDLMLAVANDGIAEEMNAMLNYLHFICQWSHYRSYYTDSNGETVLINLYPGDVEDILSDSSENGYGDMCTESYFDDLLALIDSASSTKLQDLKEIVRMAKELETEALQDLSERACTYDKETDAYIQTKDKQLYDYWNRLYLRFSGWLSAWEDEPLPDMDAHSHSSNP